MAACELEVHFDEPDRVYRGGERVRGKIVVHVEKNVQCKGLVVRSIWRTHGRGNVATGEAETDDLYSGSWQPGQTYEYPFDLVSSAWPPTYYGNILNVSHLIEARAKVPWAFDPKGQREFRVVNDDSPDDLAPTNQRNPSMGGVVGWVIGGILLLLLGTVFIFAVPILLVIGGTIWFFTSYLPKSVTGKVECHIEPSRVRPGDRMKGNISFVPKRSSRINGVRCTIKGEEICVSGSGSNRTTHRHEVSSQVIELKGATQLARGSQEQFDIDYQLPASAPPSLDLPENDLKWHVEFRVDIPLWPDFKKTIDFVVLSQASDDVNVPPVAIPAAAGTAGEPAPAQDTIGSPEKSGEWLGQVLNQLQSHAGDHANLRLILDAIQEHRFHVNLELQGTTRRPSEAEQITGGTWYEGVDSRHDLSFVVHFSDFNLPRKSSSWSGEVQIVAFATDPDFVVADAIT